MAKRVSLTDLEIEVLVSLIDGCKPPTAWKEHVIFSTAAFKKLRAKLATPPIKGKE